MMSKGTVRATSSSDVGFLRSLGMSLALCSARNHRSIGHATTDLLQMRPADRHGFKRRVDAKLRHQVLQMGPDCVGGQVQPLGYFATSRALGKAGQHIPLTRRKSGKKLVVVLLQLAFGHEQPQHMPDLSPW